MGISFHVKNFDKSCFLKTVIVMCDIGRKSVGTGALQFLQGHYQQKLRYISTTIFELSLVEQQQTKQKQRRM